MTFRQGLSKFAGAAMTPIAVLPAAAVIIALGTVLPPEFGGRAFAAAGQTLFNYLGLIIAVGCAIGLANREGIAGFAAGAMYIIIDGIVKAYNPELNLGVLAGIISAIAAAHFYHRFHAVRFPDYLSFFGGQRFVPIISAFAAVFVGLALAYVGPWLQSGIVSLGNWMAAAGILGVFAYGVIERLLIPTGLHHFLNTIVLLLVGSYAGATGDLGRFFAGDPTAGYFMSGAYAFMLFGLPAACLAMYHEAKPGAKRSVKGLMITAAATSFLTGITEPVEFSFLFTAPVLYLAHTLLAGSSFALNYALRIRHGYASSAGIVEFIANLTRADNGLLIIPIGIAYGVLYYLVFRFLIRRLNLATPGRLAEEAGMDAALAANPPALAGAPAAAGAAPASLTERAAGVIAALGGRDNLTGVDSCLTRLRIGLDDESLVDEDGLKRLGALGIVKMGQGAWQVVFGTVSDALRHEMKQILRG
ncbi:MAG: PTS transporter subunit EIIC [Chloroflexota bacterium]